MAVVRSFPEPTQLVMNPILDSSENTSNIQLKGIIRNIAEYTGYSFKNPVLLGAQPFNVGPPSVIKLEDLFTSSNNLSVHKLTTEFSSTITPPTSGKYVLNSTKSLPTPSFQGACLQTNPDGGSTAFGAANSYTLLQNFVNGFPNNSS
jgi:hypothetical protein